MPFEQVQKYPEWRQLKEKMAELLKTQNKFTYDELKQYAGGLDIRSNRGRAQFYRFRREALEDWQVWFEIVPSYGYAVVPAGQQPQAAVKRVKQARRKINLARDINTNVRIDEMTTKERAYQAQAAAVLEILSQTFNQASRSIRTQLREPKQIGNGSGPDAKSGAKKKA